MEVKLIQLSDDLAWLDGFVKENSRPASFLQSEEYSRLVFFDGQNIKLKAVEDEKVVAVFSCFKKKIFGKYYFLSCPRGPIFREGISEEKKKEVLNLVYEYFRKNKLSERVVFLRFVLNFETGFSFVKKPKIFVNLKEPEETLLLDLSGDKEDILQAMHHKTRYNIRLAQKNEVEIEVLDENSLGDSLDSFYALMEATAVRDKINIFDKKYYRQIFDKMSSGEVKVRLFLAKKDGEVLAGILNIGFGETFTYFYGASGNVGRNLMPNYLLQWSAICWAKENGYLLYDFWGVSEGNPKWQGITRFKKGFVGEKTKVESVEDKTLDMVIGKKAYEILKIAKKIRN